MTDFDWFVGIFLGFSLIFLTSLYIKYGDKLRERDAKQFGHKLHQCPIHKNNVKVAMSKKPLNDSKDDDDDDNEENQYDIHQFMQQLQIESNNESMINECFEIATEIVKLSTNCKVSTEIKLALYGLFKQSESGDIDRSEPSKLHYSEHAKWNAWQRHKGKTKLEAKKEYFYLVYNEIVKPFNLNIYLFKDDEKIPDKFKQSLQSQSVQTQQQSMSFAVSSKIDEEVFDSAIHGDPNELFNAFDLSQQIDLNEIKRYIETHQININQKNETGATFLNLAVDNNQYNLSKLLIEQFNADINLSDDMGYTPLHSAAINENKQIIKLLLEFGANRNAKSFDDDEELPSDLTQDDEIKQLLATTTTS